VLIFVFARISCGLRGAILAEFAPVPNAPSDVVLLSNRAVPAEARPLQPSLPAAPVTAPAEHGGPPGPEPTRFGDWERNGRCIDF
jgi:hypothetical protein